MKTLIKIFSTALVLMCISLLAGAQDSSALVSKPARQNPEFHYAGRTFFFQGEVKMDFAQLCFRVTGGYRFGQFGILGVGVGADIFSLGISSNDNLKDPYSGVYIPLYLHYEGDILKSRVTPFYSFEAGYGFRLGIGGSYIVVSGMDHPTYKNLGGFTGGAGFGVKLYGRRRVYACWALDLDLRQARNKYSNYYYNSSGDRIDVSYSGSALFFMPGFKVVVGF